MISCATITPKMKRIQELDCNWYLMQMYNPRGWNMCIIMYLLENTYHSPLTSLSVPKNNLPSFRSSVPFPFQHLVPKTISKDMLWLRERFQEYVEPIVGSTTQRCCHNRLHWTNTSELRHDRHISWIYMDQGNNRISETSKTSLSKWPSISKSEQFHHAVFDDQRVLWYSFSNVGMLAS